MGAIGTHNSDKLTNNPEFAILKTK